jgi:hypothetical protein
MSGRRIPDPVDQKLAEVFDAESREQPPDRMLEEVFERTRTARQARRWPWERLRIPGPGGPGALVLVGSVVLGGAALFALGGGGRPYTPAPPTPAVAVGTTPAPSPVIALCANGGGLAGDGRTLWVRCPTGIRRVDVTTSPVTAGPVLEGTGLPVTVGTQLWAPSIGMIAQLDPATGRTLRSLPISGVSLLASDGRNLWAVGGGHLMRIDPTTGAVTAGPDAIQRSLAIAVAGGAPWVTAGDGTVRRFDPVTLRIVATVPVGDAANAVATDGRALYVVSQGNAGTVTRIDVGTNGATQAILADPTDPQSLGEVAVGGTVLYVTRRTGLFALDPGSLAVRSLTPLPAYPSGLVLAGSTVWVFGDGRLDRLPAPDAASGAPSSSP